MAITPIRMSEVEAQFLRENFDMIYGEWGVVSEVEPERLNCNVIILLGSEDNKALNFIHKSAIEIFAKQPTQLLLKGPDGAKLSREEEYMYCDCSSNVSIVGHEFENTPTYLGDDPAACWKEHLNLRWAKMEQAANLSSCVKATSEKFCELIVKLYGNRNLRISRGRFIANKTAFEELELFWKQNDQMKKVKGQYEDAEEELNSFELENFYEGANSPSEELFRIMEGGIRDTDSATDAVEIEAITYGMQRRQVKLVPLEEKVQRFGGKTIAIMSMAEFLADHDRMKQMKAVALNPVIAMCENDPFSKLKMVSIQVHGEYDEGEIRKRPRAFYTIPSTTFNTFPLFISLNLPLMDPPIIFGEEEFRRLLNPNFCALIPAEQTIRLIGCDMETARFYHMFINGENQPSSSHIFDVSSRLMFMSGICISKLDGYGDFSYAMRLRDHEWGLEIVSTRSFSLELRQDICWIDVEYFFQKLHECGRDRYKIDQGKSLILTNRTDLNLHSFLIKPVTRVELEYYLTDCKREYSKLFSGTLNEIVKITGDYSLNEGNYPHLIIYAKTDVEIIFKRGVAAVENQRRRLITMMQASIVEDARNIGSKAKATNSNVSDSIKRARSANA